MVNLPLVIQPGGTATPALDGIALKIDTLFLPADNSSSSADDATRSPLHFRLIRSKNFSVAYDTTVPIEGLPEAVQGGAETYRSELAAFRTQQGGSPAPAPAISLFGQNISGSYSIVDLTIGNVPNQPILIVEWLLNLSPGFG